MCAHTTNKHHNNKTADMLQEEKTGGKKFMDFGGEILPYAAANNIKVCRRKVWRACVQQCVLCVLLCVLCSCHLVLFM